MSVPSHAGREAPTTPQGWDDEAAKLLLIDPHLFDVCADRGRPSPSIPWVGARGLSVRGLSVLGIAYTETYESNHPHAMALAEACLRMRAAIRQEMTVNQIYVEINNG